MATTVKERMNNPPTDATIGTAIFFFFLLHEPDPQKFEFSSTLAMTTGLSKTKKIKARNYNYL